MENANQQTLPPENKQQLAVATKREIRVVESEVPILDTAMFEHMNRIAMGMARASLIPDHLKGQTPEETAGNCFLIVNQAVRWDIDPIALAAASYVVKGKLGFEGKVVKAVIDTRGHTTSGLRFRYNSRQGDDLAIVCWASDTHKDLPEEAKPFLIALAERDDKSALNELEDMKIMAVRLSVGQGKTSNDIWRKDPEQKLVYSSSTKWARRWKPALLMGIKTEDDIDLENQMPRAVLQRPDLNALPTASVTDNAPEVMNPPTPAEKKERRKREPATPASEATPTTATATVTTHQAEADRTPVGATQPAQDAAQPATPPQATAPANVTQMPQTAAAKPGLPRIADGDRSPFDSEPAEEETVRYPADVSDIMTRLHNSGYTDEHGAPQPPFTEEEFVSLAIGIRYAQTTAKKVMDIKVEKRLLILADWDTEGGAIEQLRMMREMKAKRAVQKGGG